MGVEITSASPPESDYCSRMGVKSQCSFLTYTTILFISKSSQNSPNINSHRLYSCFSQILYFRLQDVHEMFYKCSVWVQVVESFYILEIKGFMLLLSSSSLIFGTLPGADHHSLPAAIGPDCPPRHCLCLLNLMSWQTCRSSQESV